MHKHELESSESWSLPVVSKLSHRIVINKKTLEDFSVFYAKNKVDSGYLNRIIFNANFVEELPKREIKNSKSFNVLYVGRNSPEKRVGLISLIAKEVASHDSTIEFHFVGDVNSAIPNDCKEFCKLHGEIADRDMLNSIYSNCHMLILASEREGFPLVIMEGMYNGLVTITTDVGGISEHINSSNGILIKEASNSEMVTAFARSILELAHDTEKWLKLSESAYNYAKVNFSKDRFYRFYNELFS
jgi:glycosyltransferase involved in cell wall biosynthesis